MAKVEIIYCYKEDEEHSNLTHKSQHQVVDPPEGEKHEKGTVWVMGTKGKPVKLYSNEFKRIYQ